MRLNQVSVRVERFGNQVPSDVAGTHQIINVYADSNNIAEAMMSAFGQAMGAVEESGVVATSSCSGVKPSLGLSCDVDSVVYGKSQISEDDALEEERSKAQRTARTIERSIDSMKEAVFAIEHAEEIVAIAKESEDRERAATLISEKFGLSSRYAGYRMLDMVAGALTKDFRGQLENDIAEAAIKLTEVKASLNDDAE